MSENLKQTPGDGYDPGQDDNEHLECAGCFKLLYDEESMTLDDGRDYCGDCVAESIYDLFPVGSVYVKWTYAQDGGKGFVFTVTPKARGAAKRGTPGELFYKEFLLSLQWEKVNQLPFDDGETQELWEIEARLGGAIIRRIGTYSLGELIDVEAE
jgi:hypothetical protein